MKMATKRRGFSFSEAQLHMAKNLFDSYRNTRGMGLPTKTLDQCRLEAAEYLSTEAELEAYSKVWFPERDHLGRVTWADGSHDDSRVCSECLAGDCQIPVHGSLTSEGDGYGELVSKSYWNWMEENGTRDDEGNLVEDVFANPDTLGGF